MGVLSASHDMHIGRILKREDEARGVETRRFQETMTRYAHWLYESRCERCGVLAIRGVAWSCVCGESVSAATQLCSIQCA